MRRSLWLVALAWAIGLLAAVYFVRSGRQHVGAGILGVPATDREQRAEIELDHSEGVHQRRIAVAAESEGELAAEQSSQVSALLAADYFSDEVPPPFRHGVVHGRAVRDEDGRAVTNADVLLTLPEGEEIAPVQRAPRRTKTDSEGMFTFEDVLEGGVKLTVSAPGRATTPRWALILADDPVATIEVRMPILRSYVVRMLDSSGGDFRLDERMLSVNDAGLLGLSVASACGVIGNSFDGRDGPAHETHSADRELGAFTWHLEVQGTEPACVHAVLGNVVLGAEPLPADAKEVGIRIDSGALAAATSPLVVRVLDTADGSVIAGAVVEVGAGRNGRTGRVRHITDEFGAIRTTLAVSSKYAAIVRAPGYAAELAELERPFPSAFVVRLSRGRSVRGIVQDARGNPIESAAVELADSVSGAGPKMGPRAKTKRDGSFQLNDVSPGIHELNAREIFSSSIRNGRVRIDCSNGDVRGVVIQVQ